MAQRQIDPRLKKIIADGDTDTLISYAMELGERVAGEDLGRTQIRNIYGMVKAFESKQPREYDHLKLMIPKLHYAAARESKLKPLVEALSDGIGLVEDDDKRFRRFASFFEAVVAYHYAASEDRKKKRR
jgi:CRISPR type III-A-associated protein Csm2